MAFHRLTVPVYAGGLRGGDDYINNAIAGTPAAADNALGSGTNSGSYFFGANEQVTTAGINRGFKALAQNCDWLDDAVVALGSEASDLADEFYEFVDDITDPTGSGIVGAAGIAGASPGVDIALSAATVQQQLTDLLNFCNRSRRQRTMTGSGTMDQGDAVFFLDSSGGAFNLQLAANFKQKFTIWDKTGSLGTNAVTLLRIGSEKINGLLANYVLDVPWGKWELVWDGTDWFIEQCRPNVQTVTTGGTWTKPLWAKHVRILCIGAGGGGYGNGPVKNGCGGGGGEVVDRTFPAALLPATLTHAIGAAGAAGSGGNGGNGGNSTVIGTGISLIALGGTGGGEGSVGTGGAGGGRGAGTTDGTPGGAFGQDGFAGGGGCGGDYATSGGKGYGGPGGLGDPVTAGVAGLGAPGYGGGGGGCCSNGALPGGGGGGGSYGVGGAGGGNGGSTTGGAGAAGAVIYISW